MSLSSKLLSADTRDILSLGVLVVLGYGVVTGYFKADAVVPIVAMVFGFWFAQKTSNGGPS